MLGGLSHTADYCPMYSLIAKNRGGKEFDCEDPALNAIINAAGVETFGANSKCFNTNLDRPLCMKYYCNAEQKKVQVVISDSQVVICPRDGAIMNLPWIDEYATFECPKLATICPDFFQYPPPPPPKNSLICPGNCSGRGYCDYSQSNPYCKCCNPNDNTVMCTNSPPGCNATNGDPTFAPSFNPSSNPSVAPSLSRETTNVTYNFCIQYGILGLKKVLTNTESVINTTLNGLFQNEANPVMTNCKVSDVQSVARNVTNPAADVKRENGDVINRNNDTRYLQSSLGDTT
eukprot:1192620-Ditylum_brightwellii.AAC.1